MNKLEVRKHIAIIHNMAKDYGLLDNEEISRTYQVIDYISNLEQQNKQLKDKCDAIDKAIEYIETIQLITQPYGKTLMQQMVNDLLEILKGSD